MRCRGRPARLKHGLISYVPIEGVRRRSCPPRLRGVKAPRIHLAGPRRNAVIVRRGSLFIPVTRTERITRETHPSGVHSAVPVFRVDPGDPGMRLTLSGKFTPSKVALWPISYPGHKGVGYMEKTPVSQAWWWTDPLAHMRRCDESYWIRRFERLGLNGAIRATV